LTIAAAAGDVQLDFEKCSPNLPRVFTLETEITMTMGEFISEDELRTFEGWSKYQGVDPTTLPPEELEEWRGCFEQAKQLSEASPKVGLMKLVRVAGEEKYAVAIRDGADLWLTMWVRCSPKSGIYVFYPRADGGNPHASYHLDGTYHHKSYGMKGIRQKRQPLTAAFRESEPMGLFAGHGKSTGAICDPTVFDGVVIVGPGIFGPKHGSVGVDLIAAGYETTWEQDVADRFYSGEVVQRQIFPRSSGPSVAITIQK
jgi:hypothetical protein